jgi:predicted ribosomally synthesized peptide with SipW-like signal peptide
MKGKATKRALISSAVSILLCVAMLIGTTFAWFTDTASTAVNKIQSGTLDVALEYATEWDASGNPTKWTSAEGATLEFEKAKGGEKQAVLWEPGCTYELPELRIVNNDNLALKYKIVVSGITGNAKLNEAIEWTMKLDGVSETLGTEHSLAAKTGEEVSANVFTISGHMKEDAGNEYQGLSIDGIGITVVATQDTVEFDSYYDEYDADAEYPVYVVENVAVGENNKVKSEVVVKTDKTVNVDDQTTEPAAKATVPQDVTMEEGKTQVALSITDNASVASGTTVGEQQASKSFEISLEGVDNTKNEKEITVEFYTEKNLSNVKIYHDGTLMGSSKYSYNSTTGKVTVTSAKFSPFDLVYDAGVKEAATAAGLVNAILNAKTGDTIKLTADIEIPVGMYSKNNRLNVSANDVTIDLNQFTLSVPNCTLTITGSNITLKNGKMAATTDYHNYIVQVCGKNAVIDGVTTEKGGINVCGDNSSDAENQSATVTITNCNITAGENWSYTVCTQCNSSAVIKSSTLTRGARAFFWAEKGTRDVESPANGVDSQISYEKSTVTFAGTYQSDANLYLGGNDGVAPTEF